MKNLILFGILVTLFTSCATTQPDQARTERIISPNYRRVIVINREIIVNGESRHYHQRIRYRKPIRH